MLNLIAVIALMFTASAEEGMWTLDNFPKAAVKKKYQVNVDDAWLEKVRLSSARLGNGCSGSFVSTDGLVMTNHHCVRGCVDQLSTAKKDFIKDGFYAKTGKDELQCPALEVNRLQSITDVTSQVRKETKGLKGTAYNDKLKAVTAQIEKKCGEEGPTTRCDVVTLYHGGQYHLYKYQRYQDVRLVFAPEITIASFGGDPDNFNFPRYNLDMAFVRVYQDGKTIANKDYFKWATESTKAGDLVFMTGNPGSTSRLLTVAQLEFERDRVLPERLIYMSELRGMLHEYRKRGPEQRRTAGDMLQGVENGLKAMKGRYKALLDKGFFGKLTKAEAELRRKVKAKPALQGQYGDGWEEIAGAVEAYRPKFTAHWNIDSSYQSKLFGIAKTLVRAADELPKANEVRLKEFTDSKLPGLKMQLMSPAPIYDELEIANLEFALTKMRENLTADHPYVKKVLGKKSPAQIAQELVSGTKLKDLKQRQALFDGGKPAIEASKDPMIQFALLADADARAVRKEYEDAIEPALKKGGEKIAQAKFAIYGTSMYPDATFSLRVTYGQIKGLNDGGKNVEPYTTLGGVFERQTGVEPFALPESWLKNQSRLDLNRHFNFASTNDIIGGNSGSPVINKNAEVVGLVFDGNIHSLGGAYGFDEPVNRAVSVSSDAMLEALEKVYGADRIVGEIRGSK